LANIKRIAATTKRNEIKESAGELMKFVVRPNADRILSTTELDILRLAFVLSGPDIPQDEDIEAFKSQKKPKQRQNQMAEQLQEQLVSI
jgi:hypothetical protein